LGLGIFIVKAKQINQRTFRYNQDMGNTKLLFRVLFIVSTMTLLISALDNRSIYAKESNYETYNDNDLGVSLRYPASWSEDSNPNEGILAVFYAPLQDDSDIFAENFNLVVEDLSSSNYPLDVYSETALDQLKSSFQNFRIEHINANASLSGYPAYYIDYTYTVPSPQGILQLKNLQTWTIVGDKAYSFTFGAQPSHFASYMPTIEKVIDSFEIHPDDSND
jgi:serine/threonine-protein kinase